MNKVLFITTVLWSSFMLEVRASELKMHLVHESFIDEQISNDPATAYRIEESKKNAVAIKQAIYTADFSVFHPSPNSKEYFMPDTLTLTLLDDAPITANRIKVEKHGPTNFTWVGRVNNDAFSIVVLTIHNEFMSGAISAHGKTYRIKPLGPNLHSVYEASDDFGREQHIQNIRNLEAPPSYPYLNGERRSSAKIAEDKNSRDASGHYIDLMIAYTDDVAAASADIEGEIDTDVAYTNQALANSCIDFRYQLVEAFPVTYTETSNSMTDLSALANTTDTSLAASSNLNDVTTQRAVNHADLVQIWVHGSDVCGLGYAPYGPSSMSAAIGFSLKLDICPSSTTAHELGHNLSLSHDRYQEDISFIDTEDTYSYGYDIVDTSHKVMTIMSYSTECSDAGISCSELPYFSNPRIFYQGTRLGIPGIADSAKKLNESWATAAAYMTSVNTGYTADLTGCMENASKDDVGSQACYVATATYGSPMHPYVKVLRQFRDRVLSQFGVGRMFIEWYYENSPPLAAAIKERPWLRGASLVMLSPVILMIAHPWLALLLLGMAFILSFTLVKRFAKHFFFAFLFALSFPLSLSAQVAAPTLDPAKMNLNPSVVGFKKAVTLLAAAYEKQESSIKTGALDKKSSDGAGLAVMGALNFSDLGAEASFRPSRDIKWSEKLNNDKDNYTETVSGGSANAALKLFNFIAFGASYSQNNSAIKKITTDTTSYGAGTALNFADLVYVGADVKYFTEEHIYSAKVSWVEKTAGVGTMIHFGNDQSLHVEASYMMAPEVIVKGEGANGKGSGAHNKTTRTLITGEGILDINSFNMTNLMIGITKGKKTEKDISETKESGGGSVTGTGYLTKTTDMTEASVVGTFQNRQFFFGASLLAEEIEYGANYKEERSTLTFKGGMRF